MRSAGGAILRFGLGLFLLTFAGLAGPAAAHEIRPTIATIEVGDNGVLDLSLSVNLEALIAAVGPEHQDSETSPQAAQYNTLRALPPSALEKAFQEFSQRLAEGITVEDQNGQRIQLQQSRVEIGPVGDVGIQRTSLVAYAGRVPEGTTILRWRFDAAFGASIIRAQTAAAAAPFYSDYLLSGARSGDIVLNATLPQAASAVFLDYVLVGFEHIVPKGLDHILFVVGLFLLSPKLSPLLWQVTCFTLAHSITLALGMLGILKAPPSIVEPLIALSILYVAVENLVTDRLNRWRPLVIFAFGLLHGLGFAGVLSDIGLTNAHFLTGLIAFNLGVEFGQLAVLGGCFLTIGLWFGHQPWYRSAVTMPASLLIAATGAFWFVERLA